MAFNIQNLFSDFVFVCLIASLFARHSLSSNYKLFVDESVFSPALGTWYGDPRGAGSGGACGWANDVQSPPFSAMIAAGNARIFLQGKGCGDCYQIKCTREPFCSGNPITITITDECPGACNNVPFHFDLSGTAFGAMANPGKAENLRNLGQVDIQYRRVPCHYGGTNIAFKLDAKTNPNWFATAIEFVDDDGGLRSVEIAPASTQQFVPMKNIWGAVWQVDLNPSQHVEIVVTKDSNDIATPDSSFSRNLTSGTIRNLVIRLRVACSGTAARARMFSPYIVLLFVVVSFQPLFSCKSLLGNLDMRKEEASSPTFGIRALGSTRGISRRASQSEKENQERIELGEMSATNSGGTGTVVPVLHELNPHADSSESVEIIESERQPDEASV
ncbi:hypothetical protein L1887_40139 [Cichorium endivia]|nr:hypothetical protein L1887_40137 [Cichorium endivia]KAI3497492.1 hypothetical protein L1887_40139 [Cichorium endivia]